MSSSNFLKSVLAGFARALQPLRDAAGSPDAFGKFLRQFGWTLTPADLANVTASVSQISSLAANPSAMSLEQLAADLTSAGKIVRRIDVSGAPAAFASTFPRELLDYLVYFALAEQNPPLFALLHFVGVFSERHVLPDAGTGRGEYIERQVRWDRLGPLADEPLRSTEQVYGWGTNFDADAFLRGLGMLVRGFGGCAGMYPADDRLLNQYYSRDSSGATGTRNLILSAPIREVSATAGSATAGIKLAFLAIPIPPSPDVAAPPDGLALMPVITGQARDNFPIADNTSIKLAGDFLARPVRAEIHPAHAVVRASAGDAHVDASARVDAKAPAGSSWIPIGSADSSRLEVSAAHVSLGMSGELDGDLDLQVEVGLDSATLVIDLSEGDGFIQTLSSQPPQSPLSFVVKWSRKSGFTLGDQPKLAITLPVGQSAGDFATLDSVSFALGAGSGNSVTLDAALFFSASIGPITATIADAGIRTLLTPADDAASPGNLGNIDLQFGFKPPSGVGLVVDAADISGGGFVGRDPVSGRYSGVLDLHSQKIGITALGLIDTKLPADQGGYALLLALRATFPAIQIGLGFALTGVGGLLALNRRADVDVLRSRLAAGTVGRILAPQDPVRNAPALLADLDAVFPVAPGITVVGPTVQLLWAGLVHLDVGVFIELPGPARVVLLGSAHAEIERDGRAYLGIRVDIVGVVDLRAETAAFDAVLVDSHLMGMLDLTGGAAFRLSWGTQPYAVLSLGGFNPAYDPEPLSFPATLTRIAMVHGAPSDELYLRFEGYFAITSNTLQFGASVEVMIQSDHFIVHGSVGFDALVQRSPFHFRFDIRASVTVAYRGQTLAGLTLTGSLTGPGPVVVQAKVCIELLFFDICFSGTFPLGPAIAPLLAAAAGLLDTLLGELDNPATLRAAGAPDPYVRLQPPDPSLTTAVIAPSGTLVWEQQSAPLDLLLTRIGGAPLPAPAQVSATSPASSTAQSDWFAPGQFIDLTDDQALTRPAYERLTGGLRLAGAGGADGPGAQALLTTTQIRLPANATTPGKPVIMFPAWILTSAPSPATPAITVRTESWIVTTPAGEHHDLTGAQARQLATLTTSARAVPATDRLAAFTF